MVNFVAVEDLKNLKPGTAKCVNINGKSIALFNVQGKIFAIDDMCSHAEASLAEGVVENGEVECPLHGARFDLKTGKHLCLPAVTPVASYEVKIEGNKIHVAI